MAIRNTIWCDECGVVIEEEADRGHHEEGNCSILLKVDSRVLFGRRQLPGTVIDLSPRVTNPGDRRLVPITLDGHGSKKHLVDLASLREPKEETTGV